MNKSLLTLTLCCWLCQSIAQTQVYGANTYQTFASAGTTNGGASNANYFLYSSVGQPMASTVALSATALQAGILSSANDVNLAYDITPPVIAHTPPANITANATLTVNITDNATGVDPTTDSIYYKPITSPESTFKKAALTAGSDNNYTATVVSSWYDAMGLEYYFTAHDRKNNRQVSASHYYVPLLTSSVALSSIFPFGSQATNYKIIAFPYDSPNEVSSIFSDNSLSNTATGRLYRFNTSSQANEEYHDISFATVSRGLGYWLLLKEQSSLTLGNVTSPLENRTDLFQMTLQPNWNLIGNPYPISINWNDVLNYSDNAASASSLSKLNYYDGTTPWATPTSLQPFQGAFVKNMSSSPITVSIPFNGQTVPGGRMANKAMPTSQDISADAWLVPLLCEQQNSVGIGGFGMDPMATSNQDWYDNFNPPSPFILPEFKFIHSEYPTVETATDMVTTAGNFNWKFSISTTGLTELSWPFLQTNSQELYLYDEKNLVLTNMLEANQYAFTNEKDTRFTIYFGQDVLKTIKSPEMEIGQPYPNPVTNEHFTSFNLALPEATNSYSVSLQLFNSAGILVGGQSQQVESGLHQINYDFKQNNLSSGMYIYRLAISSATISKISTGKIVIP